MSVSIYVPCAENECEGHKIELPDEVNEECVIVKSDRCAICGDRVQVKLSVEVLP